MVGPVMILEMNNQSIRAPLTLGHIIISTVADDNDENDKMLWRQKLSVFCDNNTMLMFFYLPPLLAPLSVETVPLAIIYPPELSKLKPQ